MRVIAGERRGFQLKGPPDKGTRPMTDMVREALFSVLASLGAGPGRVLDLYAGTGALGIEALSRWADRAEFVEQSAGAVAVIRENLTRTRYGDVAAVHQVPVLAFVARSGAGTAPFDLVFLDPPYADADIVEVLTAVGESALIQSGSLVVLGHWPRLTPPPTAGRLERLRSRRHGDSCFTVYEVPLAPSAAGPSAAGPGTDESPDGAVDAAAVGRAEDGPGAGGRGSTQE